MSGEFSATPAGVQGADGVGVITTPTNTTFVTSAHVNFAPTIANNGNVGRFLALEVQYHTGSTGGPLVRSNNPAGFTIDPGATFTPTATSTPPLSAFSALVQNTDPVGDIYAVAILHNYSLRNIPDDSWGPTIGSPVNSPYLGHVDIAEIITLTGSFNLGA
jgi:hypothetical protein